MGKRSLSSELIKSIPPSARAAGRSSTRRARPWRPAAKRNARIRRFSRGIGSIASTLVRSPLDQIQRRLRVRIHHPQQRPRRGVGRTAILLPVLQRRDGETQLGGEFGLAEPGLGADRLDVGASGDAALGGVALHETDGIFQPGDQPLEIFVLHLRNSFFKTPVSALNAFSCSSVSVSSSVLSSIQRRKTGLSRSAKKLNTR